MKKVLSMLLVLCMVLGMSVSVFAEGNTIEVADKAALDSAIASAVEGDTIKLTADIIYQTSNANEVLTIDKAITLDLGGKTLTTTNGWGGMKLKGGCSLKNGTLNHNGNTAAIKAWNVASIEDVDINVAYTENKIKGGIVIQSGTDVRIDTIKNVTIQGEGLTNGIETYNCGNASADVIGSMENVTIDAVGVGMNISAPCGTATNCTINGDVSGIEIWIKGTYSASLDLVGCTVSGGEQDVFAHDEFNSNPDIKNEGTLNLTTDNTTTFANNTIKSEFTQVEDEKAQVVLPNDESDDNNTTTEPIITEKEETYKSVIAATSNGSVKVDSKKVTRGEKVTITVTPDKGYELAALSVIDEDGNERKLTENENGTFSFRMPEGGVTIEAEFAKIGASVSAPSTEKENPSTGASDFVGAAAALAVVSVMGMAALSLKK